jgi:hypothetical protein
MCGRERLKSASDMEWSLLPSLTSKTKSAFAYTSVVAKRCLMSPVVTELVLAKEHTMSGHQPVPMYPRLTRASLIVRLNARMRAWSPTLSLKRAKGNVIKVCAKKDEIAFLSPAK